MERLSQFLDIEQILTDAVAFLPRIGVAALVLAAFWIVFRITRRPFGIILEKSGLQQVLISLLVDKIYRIFLILFMFVVFY